MGCRRVGTTAMTNGSSQTERQKRSRRKWSDPQQEGKKARTEREALERMLRSESRVTYRADNGADNSDEFSRF